MGLFFVPPEGAVAATVNGDDPPASSPKLAWPRVGASLVMLALLLVAALFTAEPANGSANRFATLHPALVHGFELLLGTFVGLIAGEAVGNR